MPAEKPILLILERDSLSKDRNLLDSLEGNLTHLFSEIVYHVPYTRSADIDSKNRLGWLPTPLRKCIKCLIVLLQPQKWDYFIPEHKKKNLPFEKRLMRVTDFIKKLQKKHSRIVILGRSSGARAAATLADELGIEKIICLGYPFKNPRNADEPERYLHLATISTPTLIIQGENDIYGGSDILQKYLLSPAIMLHFIRADHEFSPSEHEFLLILNKITYFISQ